MRDEKAPPAGSIGDAAARPRRLVLATATALALFAAAVLFVPFAGANGVVGYFGEVVGAGAGQFSSAFSPSAGAVNPTGDGSGADAGDVYFADNGNIVSDDPGIARIEQFDQYGNYIREWGWDVVAEGPGDTGANESQSVTVPGSVTNGTFQLRVLIGQGEGDRGATDSEVIELQQKVGLFRVGDDFTTGNNSVPAGTKIASIDPTGTVLQITNDASNFNGNLFASQTSEPIPFNAGAAMLQSALEDLEVIGPGNVLVTGTPGNLEVSFSGGLLAHDDILTMQPLSDGLVGGSASVGTVANGGGSEICNEADLCKYGTFPEPPGPSLRSAGSLASVNSLAVEPTTGNVLAADFGYAGYYAIGQANQVVNRRLNIFGSDGTFQGALGWGVKPEDTAPFSLDLCTTATGCEESKRGPGDMTLGGELSFDPTTGHLFEAASRNINEYALTHDGSGAVTGASLVRSFADDTVESGPDDTGSDEVQTVTVPPGISGGTFTLRFTTGNVVSYSSEGSPGDNFIDIKDLSGAVGDFQTGERVAADNGAIPPGTTITSFDESTGKLELSASLTGSMANNGFRTFEETEPINYNANANTGAGAENLQARLEALAAIGAGNVTVTGGPGVVEPFTVTFDGGTLAHDDVNQLTAVSTNLTGGESVSVDTPSEGGGYEICDPTIDTCKRGAQGSAIGQLQSPESIAVDSQGVIYVVDGSGFSARVQRFSPTPTPGTPPYTSYEPTEFDPADLHGVDFSNYPKAVGIGPGDNVFVQKVFEAGASTCDGEPSKEENRILEVSPAGVLQDTHGTCGGLRFSGMFALNRDTAVAYLTGPKPLTSDTFFGPQITGVFVIAPSEPATSAIDTVTPNTSGATVTGTINPNGPDPQVVNGTVTSYLLQYKRSIDSTWSSFGSPIPTAGGFADQDVTIHLGGLEAKTDYEIRLVAQKAGFTDVVSPIETFQTLPTPPTIYAFSSSGLTATSVNLHAIVHPHGSDTSYHFEYGTTINYGQSTPETDIGAALSPQPVTDHIDGLDQVPYHFRVVAHNDHGTTVSKDQTFTFYPPPCPNEILRQQNGSAYLPDCRSYELVSPSDAGNVTLGDAPWLVAPNATNPARFGFSGRLGAVTGTEPPIGSITDSYVATRTTTGWVTTYPGIKGNEALTVRPLGGDLGLDHFMFKKESFGITTTPQPPDNIPYVFDADGNPLGRWPADFATVPGSGATEGVFQPSPDFSHLAFSSNNVDFDPLGQGLTTAPGSAYDYDVATGTTTLISKTEAGTDIAQEPTNHSPTEFIEFPGGDGSSNARIHPSVSTDGSHILMSTASFVPASFSAAVPQHRLYMSVDAVQHYDVSKGRDVDYVGMTDDGTKVFFTTDEDLTDDGSDTDSSVDLYMWSENEGAPMVTAVSIGSGGSGNTDNCHAGWTEDCDIGVLPGSGGGMTDYPVATKSGDVYFTSPELLDGPANGIENGENLYVHRNGSVHFVTGLAIDGSAPVERINVSPDGTRAAFATKSRLTAYDNAGFRQLYSFDFATREIVCVSCLPSGDAPTDDVALTSETYTNNGGPPRLVGSGGLFMSNDGRTFFSTSDPLVPQDTNDGSDIYEYVEGRPQLISSGTGEATHKFGGGNTPQVQGLSGVSSDGVDVYFSTFDTLVPQDHNGSFRKFYDARTGGGFAPEPQIAPCEAADECHGPDSSPPPPAGIASDAYQGRAGNVSRGEARKKRCAKGKRRVSRKGKARCVRRHKTKRGRNAHRDDLNRGRTYR